MLRSATEPQQPLLSSSACCRILSPGKSTGVSKSCRRRFQSQDCALAVPLAASSPIRLPASATRSSERVHRDLNTARPAAEYQAATMAEKRVTFKNDKGEQMVGILHDTGSEDIAILCHGLGDHKNGFVLPQLAEALAKAGLSSLRFDFPGNGESDGTFRYANMMDEKEDIRAAALYLRSQGKKVTGLVGHSKGGTGVILYAAAYDDIPRVVNVAGRFDNMRGIKERFGDDIFEYLEKHGQMEITWPSSDPASGGKKTWLLLHQDMINRKTLFMDPHAWAVKQSHVLNIHGKKDETIPFEDALSFHESLPKSELVLVDGADHNFSKQPHADILIPHVVHFLTTGSVLEKTG